MAKDKLFNGFERRKFTRIDEPIPGKFRVLDRKTSEAIIDWRECGIVNISRGGACMQMPDPNNDLKEAVRNRSNMVELEVVLPVQKKIIARGNVYYFKGVGETVWDHIRKEKLEIGIRFTEISTEDEDAIADYITQRYIDKYGSP